MRKRVKTFSLLAAAGAALMASIPAHAGYFENGNEIFTKCTSREGSSTYYQDTSYCLAFVVGVVDMLTLSREIEGKSDCTPATATAGQLRDVVLSFLQGNPAERHRPAALLVLAAMRKSYPACTE